MACLCMCGHMCASCVCVCVCVVCACGENVGGGDVWPAERLAPYTDRDSLMRHTVHLQCGDADGGIGDEEMGAWKQDVTAGQNVCQVQPFTVYLV